MKRKTVNVDYLLMQLSELMKYYNEDSEEEPESEADKLPEEFKLEDSTFITNEFVTYFSDLKKQYS